MDKTRRQDKAFTLIELLVVIAIIALLLSIVIPSLKMAQKKAQEIICRSNLHQWGIVFLTYTNENNNKFWLEYNVWDTGLPQGQWMPVLSPYYGEVDKIRLCPSASKRHPNPLAQGIGATFAFWGDDGDGGSLIRGHQLTNAVDKNFGSYGINWWINNVDPPRHKGWRNKPEVHWISPLKARASTGRIPMVMDCTWFGTNPDNPSVDGSEDVSVVTPDYWENQRHETINWGNDISRLLINRHDKGINVCFMDGSAEKVFLWDLFQLKWHKQFRPETLTVSWLNQ
jgi:prepilin-type N-terminal cleavage/methylation domain-containing protein/prepilin-type processing-associated H-X9-DG protein